MAAIICPSCSKPNPDSALICLECGSILKKDPTQPLPDFLAGLAHLGDNSEDETPDWLKNLQGEIPVLSKEEPQEPITEQLPELSSTSENDLEIDFSLLNDQTISENSINNLFDESTDKPAPQFIEAAPDWLNALKTHDTPVPIQSQEEKKTQNPDVDPSVYSSLPDWLAALTGTSQEPTQIQPEHPQTEPQTSIQDNSAEWLSNLGGDFTSQEAQIEFEATSAQNSETPDWLIRMGAETNTPSSAAPLESDGEADWLNNLENRSAEPGTPAETSQTSSTPAPANEMPDWLINLGASTQDSNQQSNVVAPFNWASEDEKTASKNSTQAESAPNPFETESLAEFMAPSSNNEMLDWLSSSSGAQPPEEAVPAAPDDHSSGVASLIPSSAGEQNIDNLLSLDSSDWLSGLTPTDANKKTTETEQTPSSDLSAEELPSWVQAMRPMEAVLSGTQDINDDQSIESIGPLAGLSSILPAQPNQAEVRPPKAYSTNLVISETQKTQAALLESLLNSENTAQTFSKRQITSENRWLRWVIGAALLLAVLLMAAIDSRIFPAPAPVETGPVSMFIKTVSDLPGNSVVLLVVDYQPGFSGELEPIISPVLEQLMNKNVHLAFISSSPLGGLMADRLMQKYKNTYAYEANSQYVNLGYLPGGAGGIQAFAMRPGSILGRDILAGNLWDLPALKDVTVNSETRLSNFAALIVATDNPETGRLWIEQASPQMGSKPVLMVVSAQAEPMIRPYYLSNQLAGLVSGLEGGMEYETSLGKPGQARAYWDSFGIGVLISEIFILVGGFWSLIKSLRARRDTSTQEEA